MDTSNPLWIQVHIGDCSIGMNHWGQMHTRWSSRRMRVLLSWRIVAMKALGGSVQVIDIGQVIAFVRRKGETGTLLNLIGRSASWSRSGAGYGKAASALGAGKVARKVGRIIVRRRFVVMIGRPSHSIVSGSGIAGSMRRAMLPAMMLDHLSVRVGRC